MAADQEVMGVSSARLLSVIAAGAPFDGWCHGSGPRGGSRASLQVLGAGVFGDCGRGARAGRRVPRGASPGFPLRPLTQKIMTAWHSLTARTRRGPPRSVARLRLVFVVDRSFVVFEVKGLADASGSDRMSPPSRFVIPSFVALQLDE